MGKWTQNLCICLGNHLTSGAKFTLKWLNVKRIYDGTIPPTDELDTTKDLQKVQSHEKFLKIDDKLLVVLINHNFLIDFNRSSII